MKRRMFFEWLIKHVDLLSKKCKKVQYTFLSAFITKNMNEFLVKRLKKTENSTTFLYKIPAKRDFKMIKILKYRMFLAYLLPISNVSSIFTSNIESFFHIYFQCQKFLSYLLPISNLSSIFTSNIERFWHIYFQYWKFLSYLLPILNIPSIFTSNIESFFHIYFQYRTFLSYLLPISNISFIFTSNIESFFHIYFQYWTIIELIYLRFQTLTLTLTKWRFLF